VCVCVCVCVCVHKADIITVQRQLHHALLAAVVDKTTMLQNVQFIIRTLLALLAGLLRRTRMYMVCDLCGQKNGGAREGEGRLHCLPVSGSSTPMLDTCLWILTRRFVVGFQIRKGSTEIWRKR